MDLADHKTNNRNKICYLQTHKYECKKATAKFLIPLA